MPRLLRAGRSEDRPFLLEVLRRSALATYPALEGLGRISLRELLERTYAEYDLPTRRVWIAEEDGLAVSGLLGVMGMHPVLEEPELLVVAVATLPGHLGRGHARALLAHAMDEARRQGARAVRLFANPANPAAIRLYRGLGFSCLTEELRKALN